MEVGVASFGEVSQQARYMADRLDASGIHSDVDYLIGALDRFIPGDATAVEQARRQVVKAMRAVADQQPDDKGQPGRRGVKGEVLEALAVAEFFGDGGVQSLRAALEGYPVDSETAASRVRRLRDGINGAAISLRSLDRLLHSLMFAGLLPGPPSLDPPGVRLIFRGGAEPKDLAQLERAAKDWRKVFHALGRVVGHGEPPTIIRFSHGSLLVELATDPEVIKAFGHMVIEATKHALVCLNIVLAWRAIKSVSPEAAQTLEGDIEARRLAATKKAIAECHERYPGADSEALLELEPAVETVYRFIEDGGRVEVPSLPELEEIPEQVDTIQKELADKTPKSIEGPPDSPPKLLM